MVHIIEKRKTMLWLICWNAIKDLLQHLLYDHHRHYTSASGLKSFIFFYYRNIHYIFAVFFHHTVNNLKWIRHLPPWRNRILYRLLWTFFVDPALYLYHWLFIEHLRISVLHRMVQLFLAFAHKISPKILGKNFLSVLWNIGRNGSELGIIDLFLSNYVEIFMLLILSHLWFQTIFHFFLSKENFSIISRKRW